MSEAPDPSAGASLPYHREVRIMTDEEVLTGVLQAAASDYAIIHFERDGDTFRVWPMENGEPFTVAVVHRSKGADDAAQG